MFTYSLTNFPNVILRSDGAFVPVDINNMHYRQYLAWLASGNTPTPAPTPAPAIPSVNMWQARAVMSQTPYTSNSAQVTYQTLLANTTNVLAATNLLVAAANNPVLSAYWEYATTININDSGLQGLALNLGLSNTEVTALFANAAALSI